MAVGRHERYASVVRVSGKAAGRPATRAVLESSSRWWGGVSCVFVSHCWSIAHCRIRRHFQMRSVNSVQPAHGMRIRHNERLDTALITAQCPASDPALLQSHRHSLPLSTQSTWQPRPSGHPLHRHPLHSRLSSPASTSQLATLRPSTAVLQWWLRSWMYRRCVHATPRASAVPLRGAVM